MSIINIKSIKIVITICFLIVLPSMLHAQDGFGDEVAEAPIDGGLSLLIAAGVGYGAKKMKEKKDKKG